MASGSERPGNPIGSRRSRPPSRDSVSSGSSKSTPQVSEEPISKMSGSSIASARLPVKVWASLATCILSAVKAFGISTMKHLGKLSLVCGDVVFRGRFRRSGDDQRLKRGLFRPKAACRNSADDASIRESFDHFAAWLWRLDRELIEKVRR